MFAGKNCPRFLFAPHHLMGPADFVLTCSGFCWDPSACPWARLPVLPPAGVSKSTAARPVGRESQARAGRFVESRGWQSQPAPQRTVSLWPLLVSLWITPLPGTHENYSLMSKCQTCCRVQSLNLQGCGKINSVLPWLPCSILALTLPPVRMPWPAERMGKLGFK